MTNLIGLCGYALAGKDTAARNMEGWTRFAFADRLKADLLPMLEDIGCTLENPSHKAMVRDLLVAWGKTARKFKPGYWIGRLFDGSLGVADAINSGQSIVITDVRYPNEVARILAEGGIVVFIDRPNVRPANSEEATSIDEILCRWQTIPVVHNNGTKEDLGRKVLLAAGVTQP